MHFGTKETKKKQKRKARIDAAIFGSKPRAPFSFSFSFLSLSFFFWPIFLTTYVVPEEPGPFDDPSTWGFGRSGDSRGMAWE